MKDTRFAQTINDMTFTPEPNPNIAQFAKPKASVTLKDDEGTIHSFAVEIKSNQDGPIPDTQLMSKILQAIESHGVSSGEISEMSTNGEPLKFEVVSFKYERREDKKK